MRTDLAAVGHAWQDFVDHMADFQSDLLRRTAATMAEAQDRAARRDIEGATDWRDLSPDNTRKENRHAGAR